MARQSHSTSTSVSYVSSTNRSMHIPQMYILFCNEIEFSNSFLKSSHHDEIFCHTSLKITRALRACKVFWNEKWWWWETWQCLVTRADWHWLSDAWSPCLLSRLTWTLLRNQRKCRKQRKLNILSMRRRNLMMKRIHSLACWSGLVAYFPLSASQPTSEAWGASSLPGNYRWHELCWHNKSWFWWAGKITKHGNAIWPNWDGNVYLD